MTTANEAYMIVVQDNASEHYSFGVHSNVVYASYEEAKTALQNAAGNFDSFLPVAYGKAFPYESTSFDEMLKDGFAPYGWGVIQTDGEVYRICIGLMKVSFRP
jgi:hypothetical protein